MAAEARAAAASMRNSIRDDKRRVEYTKYPPEAARRYAIPVLSPWRAGDHFLKRASKWGPDPAAARAGVRRPKPKAAREGNASDGLRESVRARKGMVQGLMVTRAANAAPIAGGESSSGRSRGGSRFWAERRPVVTNKNPMEEETPEEREEESSHPITYANARYVARNPPENNSNRRGRGRGRGVDENLRRMSGISRTVHGDSAAASPAEYPVVSDCTIIEPNPYGTVWVWIWSGMLPSSQKQQPN